jgi:hypothetical protein
MEHNDFKLDTPEGYLQVPVPFSETNCLNLKSEPNAAFDFSKSYSPLKFELISRTGINLSNYSMVYHQEVWLMSDEMFELIGCEKVFTIELLKLNYIRRFEPNKFKAIVAKKGLDFILNLEPNKLGELLSLPLGFINCEDYAVANMVLTFNQYVLALLGIEPLCKLTLQKLRILRAFSAHTIMEIGIENILSMSSQRLLSFLKINKEIIEVLGYEFLLSQDESYLTALTEVSLEWVKRVGIENVKSFNAGDIRRILVSGE